MKRFDEFDDLITLNDLKRIDSFITRNHKLIDEERNNLLQYSLKKHKVSKDLLNLILKKKIDPNIPNDNNLLPLDISINTMQSNEIISILLKKTKNKYIQSPLTPYSALYLYLEKAEISLDLVQHMLKKKSNPNYFPEKSAHPFVLLLKNSCNETIKVECLNLLSKHHLSFGNVTEKLVYLLENSENTNLNFKFINFFLEINPLLSESSFKTILEQKNISIDIIKLLFNYKMDITTKKVQFSPLHSICTNKGLSVEYLKLFVENKADLNIKNQDSNSILHLFSKNSKSSVQIIEYLFQFEIKFYSNHNGQTALHLISDNNLTPNIFIDLFLQKKCDPKVEDKNGKTFFDYL